LQATGGSDGFAGGAGAGEADAGAGDAGAVALADPSAVDGAETEATFVAVAVAGAAFGGSGVRQPTLARRPANAVKETDRRTTDIFIRVPRRERDVQIVLGWRSGS
jgi:hypothetical protein